MRVLYHTLLSPAARKVRIVLREKNLEFTLKAEKTWERRPEFLALNPAGEVPVLIEPDGTVLADAAAIIEYLDEVYREKMLIGINPIDRAEVRRLTGWFDVKMNLEVTENLLGEKMMKRWLGHGQPNSRAIRAGHANLPHHLDYIGYLVERRRWLAGDHFSIAGHHRGGAAVEPPTIWATCPGTATSRPGMVCADQVAPELSPDSRRPPAGRAAARALRRPRLLIHRASRRTPSSRARCRSSRDTRPPDTRRATAIGTADR